MGIFRRLFKKRRDDRKDSILIKNQIFNENNKKNVDSNSMLLQTRDRTDIINKEKRSEFGGIDIEEGGELKGSSINVLVNVLERIKQTKEEIQRNNPIEEKEDCLPDTRLKEVNVFPIHLFTLYKESRLLPNDFVVQSTAEVFLTNMGQIKIEKTQCNYDAHSLMNHATPFTISKVVLIDQLPELIKQSKDKEATKYVGMNQENWKEFLKM